MVDRPTLPVCVIVGAGAGNGMALARKFSKQGYSVALLARNKIALDKRIEEDKELNGVFSYRCDVTDHNEVTHVFEDIRAQQGTVSSLIYNAGNAVFDSINNASMNTLEQAWKTNIKGLLLCSQALIPEMKTLNDNNSVETKASIVIIGATASVKGSANFLSFTAAKGGQRNMAESMARSLGPEGIHVAYVVIDGVIDTPMTRGFIKNKEDDFFLSPDAIADTVYHLSAQEKSAWSFEVDIRPFLEKW